LSDQREVPEHRGKKAVYSVEQIKRGGESTGGGGVKQASTGKRFANRKESSGKRTQVWKSRAKASPAMRKKDFRRKHPREKDAAAPQGNFAR